VTEFVVQDDSAARMASAATKFAFTRPRSMVTLDLTVLAVILIGGMTQHGRGFVVGAVIGVLLVPFLYLVQRRQVRRALAGRGFRPGTTITTDFDDDGFTVTTPTGSARHAYGDIGRVAVYGDAVAMWLRAPRYVVVLPRQLVADLDRLRAVSAARSG
jgi:hypothetical protein